MNERKLKIAKILLLLGVVALIGLYTYPIAGIVLFAIFFVLFGIFLFMDDYEPLN